MFFLLQNWRTRTGSARRWGEEVALITYTHVSRCKNYKIKLEKK
jgi:hypothetical protein